MGNNMLLPVSRYTSPAFPRNPPFARGSYTQETSSNQSRGPKADQLRTIVIVVVVSRFLLFPTLTPHPINPHSNFPSSLLLSPPPPTRAPIFFQFPDTCLWKAKGATHHDTHIRLNGTMVPQTAPVPSSIL